MWMSSGEVRRQFPQILLMADANSAYTLRDIDHLRRLDDFDLMMIEQPLAHDDIIDHAKLQAVGNPDLSRRVHPLRASRQQAIDLDAGRIINIKLGRVGGFAEAISVHNVCAANNIPVWCGGMLEGGIGRAHNIALSSLAGFTLPGDVSASARYWKQDIVKPPVSVSAQGTIALTDAPGFGYELDKDFLRSVTVREETIARK